MTTANIDKINIFDRVEKNLGKQNKIMMVTSISFFFHNVFICIPYYLKFRIVKKVYTSIL